MVAKQIEDIITLDLHRISRYTFVPTATRFVGLASQHSTDHQLSGQSHLFDVVSRQRLNDPVPVTYPGTQMDQVDIGMTRK